MNRDLGTGSVIYQVGMYDGQLTLNIDGDDIVSIEFPEDMRTIQLSDAMLLMGIPIEYRAECCMDSPLICKAANDDKTDDVLYNSPELDEFLSEFVVTRKGGVS